MKFDEFPHLRLACGLLRAKQDGQPTASGQALDVLAGLDREELANLALAAVHVSWLLSKGHELADLREQIGMTR